MTPAARLQAAITVLEAWQGGTPAEAALLQWARSSRYAGSKDRAAVRDITFQSLRCLTSYATLGGADTGRGIVLGYCRAHELDIPSLFNGVGYGPQALSEAETAALTVHPALTPAQRSNLPEWVWQLAQQDLSDGAMAWASKQQARAPVTLRVNTAKTTREAAQAALAEQDIATAPDTLINTALTVTENPRRVAQSKAFQQGWVELQDAASQAAAAAIPVPEGGRVLDLCAGGGGKSLALVAQNKAQFFAHDAHPKRLVDLPERAARAGADISIVTKQDLKAADKFDVVICDVPCSGSGTWRRAAEAKWRLSEAGFDTLLHTQGEILDQALALLKPGGTLAYITCSVFRAENEDQVAELVSRHDNVSEDFNQRIGSEASDDLFVACLKTS